MKKKRHEQQFLREEFKKLFYIIKLFFFFLLLSSNLLWATQTYAQDALFNLNLNNVSLEEVFDAIRQQSEFEFFYNNDQVNTSVKVNVKAKNANIESVLKQALPAIYEYTIDNRYILIYKRKEITSDQSSPTQPQSKQQVKKTITGIVTDKDGESIIGANILEVGTTNGAISNVDGRFSLQVEENAFIRISYIGYLVQEINTTGKTTFNITLLEDTQALEELVVVAYGTQKKIALTGAVSSLQTKDLLSSSSANLANALSGKMSGLITIQSSGQPGKDDATMYLRGVGTTNGQQPLILIDGVPRDNIMAIDANEVASVSILKDASATAVFGVRGANGVILINTRRGNAEKTEFSVNVENSWQSFIRKPARIHSWEYMALRNEALSNDKRDILYDDEIITRYSNPNKTDLEEYMYPDHYYYGESIKEFTPQTRMNINMSGGSQKFQYFVSATYLYQGGQFKTEPESKLGYNPQTRLNRFSFRSNIDYELHKNLKTFLNLGNYIEKVGMPGSNITGVNMDNSIIEAMYLLNVTLPITPGPTTIAGFDVPPDEVIVADYLPERSGFMIINRVGERKETRLNLNGSLGAEWNLGFLTDGLSTRIMISFDNRAANTTVSTIMPRKYNVKLDYDNHTIYFPGIKSEKFPIILNKSANSRYSINLQYSLNYERAFNEDHRVGGLLLTQRDYWESSRGEMPYNYLGLVGRLSYSYKYRYLFDINTGYNGSEQFSPKNRFGFFPSFSAGWVIGNESFFQNLAGKETITNMKLRASYGLVGNDKLSGVRFLYLDENTIETSSGVNGPFYAEEPIPSLGRGRYIKEGKIGNPDLQWEVAKKINLGVDLTFLNALSLTVDYYQGTTNKILITRHTVPMIQGVDLNKVPKSNQGKMKNSGFESELVYTKQINKDLFLNFRGNIGYNKNKVVYFDEALLPEDYYYRSRITGYIYGQQWGYLINYDNGNGFFNSQDEIEGYLDKNGDKIVYEMGTPRPGDFKYRDLNGDGRINAKDMAPIGGSSIPQVAYGVMLGANYKWFDLSVIVQGLAKYYNYYSFNNVFELGLQGAYLDYHKNAWTVERYETGEKISYPSLGTIQNVNHQPNDFFIMDRSFLRLKEMMFGFTLPRNLTPRGVVSFRIYVSGQNIFTLDKLPTKTFDPEQGSPNSYPITRTMSVGFNAFF